MAGTSEPLSSVGTTRRSRNSVAVARLAALFARRAIRAGDEQALPYVPRANILQ